MSKVMVGILQCDNNSWHHSVLLINISRGGLMIETKDLFFTRRWPNLIATYSL